ncbi:MULTISPECIES: phosphatidylinositol-specific phospholipase C domain-containing protein [unclassified Adlercreutzia]|uniref:phosphatidylinositol-specific phospholipase C domain-containing protein n=1 Tax=unclassified Adlercreutzia TaxID=2636013 RepID=UPI0013EB4F25|nr:MULTISPECIES: phosphatidylinositol-specific phospholipase C domain-containing protein [unclassified Adlercreutzia]
MTQGASDSQDSSDLLRQITPSWIARPEGDAPSGALVSAAAWRAPLTRRGFFAASALAASTLLVGAPHVPGSSGAPGAWGLGAQPAWADDPDNNVGDKLSDYIIRLRPKGFLRTVSVHGDGTVVGQVCWLYQQGTSSKHHLSYHPDLGGYSIHTMSNFEEKKLSSNNVWSVDGDSRDEGKAIHVWSGGYDEKASRVFKFSRQDDGTYLIKNVNSGRYLSLENVNDDTNENKVVQRGSAMAWEVEIVGVGVAGSSDDDVDERYPTSQFCKSYSSFPLGPCWMGSMTAVGGDTLLSAISLPGTHDSGALSIDNDTEPQTSMAKCQQDYIPTQLNLGIRYLDMRLGNGDDPGVNHGGMYAYRKDHTGLKLSDVFEYCKTFLGANSTETIVMLATNSDGDNAKITSAFAKYLGEKKPDSDETWFYDGRHVPTLAEARGKIVLLRRFTPEGADKDAYQYGIDLHDWDAKVEASGEDGLALIHEELVEEKSGDAVTDRRYTTVYAQDNYNVPADDKPPYVDTALADAEGLPDDATQKVKVTEDGQEQEVSVPKANYAINYTSSSRFVHSYSNPFYAAQAMNEHLYKSPYFYNDRVNTSSSKCKFIGIIPSDFTDAVLARSIYERQVLQPSFTPGACAVPPDQVTLTYGDDFASAQFAGGGRCGKDYYRLTGASAPLDVAHAGAGLGATCALTYVSVDPFGPEREAWSKEGVPLTVLPRPVSLVWEGIDGLVSAADVRSKVVAKLQNVIDGDDLSARLEFCYDSGGAPGAAVDASKLGALGEGTYWVRAAGLAGEKAVDYELVDDGRVSFTVSRASADGAGAGSGSAGAAGAAGAGEAAGTPLAPTGDDADVASMAAGAVAAAAAVAAAGAYACASADDGAGAVR